jgi:hypothetical protein
LTFKICIIIQIMIAAKVRRPLAIVGTGPSHNQYNWDYELIGKDVFALNGAITAHKDHPRVSWVVTELGLRVYRKKRQNPYRSYLRNWSGKIIPYDPAEVLILSKAGMTSLCIAFHVAFLRGYRRLYLYGVDFTTQLVNPTGQRTRDRQAYYAEEFRWLPRPQNKLRHLEAGVRRHYSVWRDYVRFGQHTLWKDCPYEVVE